MIQSSKFKHFRITLKLFFCHIHLNLTRNFGLDSSQVKRLKYKKHSYMYPCFCLFVYKNIIFVDM